MYKNFENLTGDKKKRILDICIGEFAKNGYEGTSTNEIVKRAGISKGILFHYFGNKKNLYLYIVDYILEYALNKFYSDSEKFSSDLFERIIQTGMRKLKIAYEEPLVHELLYKTFINTPDDLKDEVKTRFEKLYDKEVPGFFDDVDTLLFRSDIDLQKAVEVVLIFMEGLQTKYLNQYKNQPADKVYSQMGKIMEEIRQYMEILKKGIYR